MTTLADLTNRINAKLADEAKLKKAKAATKAARNDGERRAANEEALEIQSRMDWRPVALVLRKDHWQCGCGEEGEAPGGLFIYYEHTRIANTTKLAPPRTQANISNDLPRRVQVDARPVAICPACAPRLGFTKPLKEKRA